MSLNIESGIGMTDSESYVDVAYVDAYFLKRGNTEWDLIDNKEAQIIKAMDYFESSYLFKGEKLNQNQALAFPRLINGVVEFPTRVKSAICELALKSSTAVLLEDTSKSVLSEKVGELEVSYDPNSRDGINYEFVFNLIAPWLNSSGFSSSIVRTY
jgi:hypothetical protein